MTLPPWRLRIFETLPSTQDVCRALAEAGEPERVAVRADVQTSGRGREGRGWQSPPGNLALSALLRPHSRAAEAGQWSLLAGVALADAVADLLPGGGAPLRLKWPNDLLLGEAKLAGILVDSAAGADGRIDWLVIGFGVNLAAAPDLPGRRTACVADAAPPPSPGAFAGRLLDSLDRWTGIHATAGFAAIRAAWIARGPAIGEALAVRRGCASVAGAFAGVRDDGALLLDMGGRAAAFTSGEIEEVRPCCS